MLDAVGGSVDWMLIKSGAAVQRMVYRKQRPSEFYEQQLDFYFDNGIVDDPASLFHFPTRAHACEMESETPYHGGVLTKALQVMALQPDPYSKRIHLLPAWPKDWNVHFKLHAPYRTTVECEYRNGKIVTLKVEPPERASDVVVAPLDE